MLVRCNPRCKESNGQTDCSLDVETNNAICNTCGDVLPDISEFSKLSMKTTGDIIRNTKSKAFTFPCNTCDKQIQAVLVNGVLVGKNCPNEQKGCLINVTEPMIAAIKEFGD
jgi:hypothetical protein